MELKRTVHTKDLAFLAGKKRQSPRTGFVHLFYGDHEAVDAVPIYENVCFVLALLLQKTGEAVLEAKRLLLRLLDFQVDQFPVYLHDFPHCYDFYLGLKLAPLFLRILDFRSVLGEVVVEKLHLSLQKLHLFYENKECTALWQFRLNVCFGIYRNNLKNRFCAASDLPQHSHSHSRLALRQWSFAPNANAEDPPCPNPDSSGCFGITSAPFPSDTSTFSAADWWEYWVSLQFIQRPICDFYHSGLQMAKGFTRQQDRFESAPYLIDWIGSESFLPHLLKDRPEHLRLVALDQVDIRSSDCADFYQQDADYYWKGTSSIHSLVGENISGGIATLSSFFEEGGRDDVFEIAYYCDASPDIRIEINGKKGTLFYLGDQITIHSPTRSFRLLFELLEGKGEFCGHIFRSNRPRQIATFGKEQHEAFDWKIGLRTLRRSSTCVLRVVLSVLDSLAIHC